MRVTHSLHSVPEKWEHSSPPPDGTNINLHIGFRVKLLHRGNPLIDALHEVSNPEHSKYGEHLSKELVAELVAPQSSGKYPSAFELLNFSEQKIRRFLFGLSTFRLI
ncbi:hypothetical protein BC827DRAFT_1175138 [Russula dissimulans]|nr:hypothetical protein BC827DRAFT_1175138 [Russula dissimulans]